MNGSKWIAGVLGGCLSLWALGVQAEVMPSTRERPSPATSDTHLIAQATGICPAQLSGQIAAIANRPNLQRSRWGILVQRLDTGETLFAQEAQRFFIPASNVKVLTTAAALERLGARFQMRTSVYQVPSQTGAIARVVGRGDPSLTEAQLQQLAQQLRQRGITRLDRLIADDTHFKGDFTNPNWELSDTQTDYGAPVNSLILNQNAIGERSVPNPTQHFLQRFQRVLNATQITVAGTAIAPAPTTSPQPELAAVLSPPLSTLVVETNQNSNNLYAEALLRSLGATTNPNEDSLAAGIAAIEATLSRLGVDPQGIDLSDGSGLSRHNLVTPEALVQTLRGMARSPNATVFRNSLAIAGSRGTLQNRFRDTPVQGRLQGKTGALSGVATLSGYLDPPNYSPLVFAILLNHFDQPVRTVRPAIDEIVLLLGRLRDCG
ncbi:D-alanyl-D-alanine carboxypeptidase/D-alanyl-D-alanine-endopeptidase [Oscillatoria sp. FACHB-1407]|uniref:D-alanyl-D-alanine carboxypeptidase/D-alanyl-D-alanine endopeptidase n=1 Tax=Oscillatoria sp. FACHB-1407 TaxID=2692847 RepID=UPI001686DDCA|nr:D-alanyl-D-alanine carboxypeptidase/D-alanyl-D-alanine-endopeptidase [Oscillatoria sp. FACHB-1407]MBD2460370.1 D-alanyl-D-alanine carboxypeptidase/D-alanyl-D-alanine-endopeptidase [Oscillatoria sp. FACHB-1407]